jgi:hypothetical protein
MIKKRIFLAMTEKSNKVLSSKRTGAAGNRQDNLRKGAPEHREERRQGQ